MMTVLHLVAMHCTLASSCARYFSPMENHHDVIAWLLTNIHVPCFSFLGGCLPTKKCDQ